MGATASAGSKLDRFELEPLSANVLKYRQSRTYHANTTGCSLPEGESLDDQPITRGHGTFELLGQSKIVNSVDSEKALWTPELPSDFTDAAMTDKTTLGIKDGVMYIGSTSGALDADVFPEQYYHALRRLP